MAALICNLCVLPCKACGECSAQACKECSQCCKYLEETCAPLTNALCDPERPFSSCVCMTLFITLIPAVAVVAIAGSAFGSVGSSCSASNLPIYAIVHVAIFAGHLAFAVYMNAQFVVVDRRQAVVAKFWHMFCWDPAVLCYFLFVVFNIV